MDDIDFDDHNKPTGDLKQITDATAALKNKYSALEDAIKLVKDIKDEISYLEGVELPDLMDNCSISELKLDSGEKLIIKNIIKANLPTKSAIEGQKDENKKAAMQHRLNEGLDWLRDNDGEDLIKNRIVVEFSKGQDNLAGDFEGKAAENGLPALRDQGVHPSTLSKFVAEKMKLGVNIPMDTLGVYCGRKAEVKKA